MILGEYVVAFALCQDLVEVDVAADGDDLVAGGTTVAQVASFGDVLFDDDYNVCVAVDAAVICGLIFVFVVVAVDDADNFAAFHVDT